MTNTNENNLKCKSHEIYDLAELYISREILKCDSSLINDLMNNAEELGSIGSNFTYDFVENIYNISPSWINDLPKEHQDLLQQYNLHSMEDLYDFMFVFENGEIAYDSLGNELYIDNPEHLKILSDINFVWEHRDSEAQEVFEWWSVTKWLADELISLGEPVLANDYGYWWGRTCTGQAIIMDGTFQKIAAKFI